MILNYNWRDKFQRHIRNRGETYFRNNLVSIIDFNNDILRAAVESSSNSIKYRVTMFILDGKVKEMTCNCPYAKSGNNCKHMAATLMELEYRDDNDHSIVDEIIKKPIAEEEKNISFFKDQEYSYFDFNAIFNKANVTEEMFNRGKKFLEENEVIVVDEVLRRDYTNTEKTYHIKALIGEKKELVSILFERDNVERANCQIENCPFGYFESWRYRVLDPCVHLTALMIYAHDRIISEQIGDNTDYIAENLFHNFRLKDLSGLANNPKEPIDQVVEVYPIVERSNKELVVSFKVGTDKLYVVKDLNDFVKAVNEESDATYGKNTVIPHNKSAFGEYYRYVEFIKKYVAEEDVLQKRLAEKHVYSSSLGVKRYLSIYGSRIDDLFEIIGDGNIEFIEKDYSSSKNKIKTAEKNPVIDMYIAMIKRRGYNTAANGFPGITVDVDLSGLYSGRENLYVINSTGFYKADSDFSKALEPLREMADKYGSLLNFEVGKNNLNYFYDEFLPSMAKYLNINEEDSGAIHDNMSASPEYEFNLDQKDGQVTCKAKAIYESGEHSISPGKPSMLGVRAGEAYVTFFLSNWFEGYNQEKETFYLDAKEDGIFDFLKNGVDGLMKIGQVNVTEAFKNLKVKRKANISVGVKIESGLLDLTIESNEIDKSELLDILKNYKEKKKYYRLKNGEYLDLQDESIAALSDITTGMGIKDSDLTKDSHSIPIYRSLYLDKYLEREGVTSNRDKHYKNLVKDFKTIDDSDFEEPESLQKILRHYQKKVTSGLELLKIINLVESWLMIWVLVRHCR